LVDTRVGCAFRTSSRRPETDAARAQKQLAADEATTAPAPQDYR
jgi:hypothetical protein